MLLSLFFDNMNASLELVLIGAFIFAVYWLVLRKHNSLGLRMLVLCTLLFVGCCVWLYKDEADLSKILNSGEQHIATVLEKEKTGNNEFEVEISFTANDGKSISTKTSKYISKEEWDKFETGKPLSVIYVAASNGTYVQQSIMRFKEDKVYLYYFSGFWLVLGIALYTWLRKFKVGVDEETGAEWVEEEDGAIILDERKSKTAGVIKRMNIFSKLLQAFGK